MSEIRRSRRERTRSLNYTSYEPYDKDSRRKSLLSKMRMVKIASLQVVAEEACSHTVGAHFRNSISFTIVRQFKDRKF